MNFCDKTCTKWEGTDWCVGEILVTDTALVKTLRQQEAEVRFGSGCHIPEAQHLNGRF